MRKRISLLIAALMLALTMSFGSVAAFALSPEQECAQEAAAAGADTYVYSNTSGVKSCTYEVEHDLACIRKDRRGGWGERRPL